MKKIVVRGFKKEVFSPVEVLEAKESKLELKSSYQFSTSRAVAEVHEINFEKTDLLEFVFDDNTTWVGSPDIIHDILKGALITIDMQGVRVKRLPILRKK